MSDTDEEPDDDLDFDMPCFNCAHNEECAESERDCKGYEPIRLTL